MQCVPNAWRQKRHTKKVSILRARGRTYGRRGEWSTTPRGIINVEGAENAAGKHILNEEKLIFCTEQILRDWDAHKVVCDFLG
jgi:hypothetical protein